MIRANHRKVLVLISVLLVAIGASAIALGTSDQKGPPPTPPKITDPLISTDIGGDPGPYRFAARVIPNSEKPDKFNAAKDTGAKHDPPISTIVNIDLYGFDDNWKHVKFDSKALKTGEVLVILSAEYIKKMTGKELTAVKAFFYSDDGKGWTQIESGKDDFLEAGRTDTYAWFKVGSWPLDDRFIGCD